MSLGKETERGLKELLRANAEDYMTLALLAEKMEAAGKAEEAKLLREKAAVELGHAKAIFETLVRAGGLKETAKELAEVEDLQHVSEYNVVAMKAKEEGHPEIERMLCSFAEQERGIAEALKQAAKAL
jgi:rubrerythrin